MASLKISLKDSAGAKLSAGAESSLQLRNWVYWKRKNRQLTAYGAFNLSPNVVWLKKSVSRSTCPKFSGTTPGAIVKLTPNSFFGVDILKEGWNSRFLVPFHCMYNSFFTNFVWLQHLGFSFDFSQIFRKDWCHLLTPVRFSCGYF